MNSLKVIAGIGAGFGMVALVLASPVFLPSLAASVETVQTHTVETMESLLPEPEPFDPSRLLKVSENYEFELAPYVSTEPQRQNTIRKIGFGHAENVVVVETPSGTYSSDGLNSPHVEYPGITKRRIHDALGIAFWSNGRWVMQQALNAGSFVTITRFNGGQLIVSDDGMCVATADSIRC